jgi:hypothetical protein
MMAVYAWIGHYRWTEDASWLWPLVMSAGSYALVIYLFFGIARLSFEGRTAMLLVAGLIAMVLSLAVSGFTSVWMTTIGWAVLISAGLVVGRMTLDRRGPGRVYIVGVVAVAVLSLVQWLPSLADVLSVSQASLSTMAESARPGLLASGYTVEQTDRLLADFAGMLQAVLRLMPAALIMGVIGQFTLGYFLFSRWLSARDASHQLAVFSQWKMPFMFTPILMLAIVLRLLGGDDIRLVADNSLAILAVFYCATGLALVEFVLKRARTTRFVKILFYVLLFFTQILGFMVTAVLGFVDSFVDWRKLSVQQTAK